MDVLVAQARFTQDAAVGGREVEQPAAGAVRTDDRLSSACDTTGAEGVPGRLGYLAANDPRMQGTLRLILGQLGAGSDGLLYRYPPGGAYDGLSGRENLFAICSFWCVDCLARQGRLDEAHALFERLLALRNPLGLYAEEFDAETGRHLGNFPQAFSHLALMEAAARIMIPELLERR